MNLPLFIVCAILMLVIIVLTVLTILGRHRYYSTLAHPSNWCYADWMCGGTPADMSTSESPVLDMIPKIYACNANNFTVTTAPRTFTFSNTTDVQSDTPITIPTGSTCVCPVQFIKDYTLNTTTGKLVPVPTPPATDHDYYICDSFHNANPSDVNSGSAGSVDGWACPIATCQAYWAANPTIFTTTLMKAPVATTGTAAAWPTKVSIPDRPAPVGWTVFGNFPATIPTYSDSIILSQLS
jgi:hypothetical protein